MQDKVHVPHRYCYYNLKIIECELLTFKSMSCLLLLLFDTKGYPLRGEDSQ